MSIYSGLFVLAVAVILRDASAASKEEKDAIKEAIRPILTECAKEHGVTMEAIKAAKETRTSDGIDPCFLACFFKKTQVMDDSGKFNPEIAKKQTRVFIHDEEGIKKSDAATDDCTSVNDAEVSDGDKGCERAKLLADCLGKHKQDEYVL